METVPRKNIFNQDTRLRIKDPSDPEFEPLARSADRIGKTLSIARVQRDADLQASLDDFLGAVYALVFSKLGGFVDRPNRFPEIAAVERRAGQIVKGEIRIDGKWMAGFHFNSALFRLAAVYHRILKIVVGRPATTDHVKDLRPKAEDLYRLRKKAEWSSRHIDSVHRQVNDLKHTSPGVYHGRKVKYEDAVAAVGELLDLLEAWAHPRIP